MEGPAPHSPSDKNNHQLGSGVSTREGQSGEQLWVKQALAGQGTSREPDKSHLEWLRPSMPCMTLTILVHFSSAISLGSGM